MIRILVLSLSSALFLSACASGTFKQRQEQREKMAASAGMYCEFVSGDVHPDLDVELNMLMAKRCDSNRPFSITNFKNSSDQNGIMYCCATTGRTYAAPAPAAKPRSEAKSVAKPAPTAETTTNVSTDDVVPAQ